MMEEKRIYVVIPAVVEVPADTFVHDGKSFVNFQRGVKHVVQPPGRQIAQACHVVSKLRLDILEKAEQKEFQPITTIILQARDSKEMVHNYIALRSKRLDPILFSDENEEAYGKRFRPVTALAVLATPKQVVGVLDYLPLWGS